MKKIILAVLVCGLFNTSVAYSDPSIIVIDPQAAILNTEFAKEKLAELSKKYSPEQSQLRQLVQELKKLRQKMEQDSAVMSESEKRDLETEYNRKSKESRFKQKQLNNTKNAKLQELMDTLRPKFESTLEKLAKQEKYTLIFDRRTTMFVSKERDITNKLTELLNQN